MCRIYYHMRLYVRSKQEFTGAVLFFIIGFNAFSILRNLVLNIGDSGYCPEDQLPLKRTQEVS